MKVNTKWQTYEQYVVDGKPVGLDGKPVKTVIVQEWRDEKHRMDYGTVCNNTTGQGYHLKGFDDLVHHVAHCLSKGHVIEIIPDYDRPEEHKY